MLATVRCRFGLEPAPGAVVEPLPLLTLRARRGIEVMVRGDERCFID